MTYIYTTSTVLRLSAFSLYTGSFPRVKLQKENSRALFIILPYILRDNEGPSAQTNHLHQRRFCIHAKVDLLNLCNQPPWFFLTAYFTFIRSAREEMDQRWQRHNREMRERETERHNEWRLSKKSTKLQFGTSV